MRCYSRPNHSPSHSFEYFKVPDIVNFYTCLFLYDSLRVVSLMAIHSQRRTLNSVVNEGCLETFSQIKSKEVKRFHFRQLWI